jgi:hypothetical protein
MRVKGAGVITLSLPARRLACAADLPQSPLWQIGADLQDQVGEEGARASGARRGLLMSPLMRTDVEVDVRAQAAYRLRWLFDLRACEPLMEVLENRAETARVRAEAAEGIGFLLNLSDRRSRLFKRATRLLIETLRDPAPEIRFWSCYALGTMRARAALPELRRLAETDDAMCPGWWLVREEAGDAIGVILGGCFPERRPASWSAHPDGQCLSSLIANAGPCAN